MPTVFAASTMRVPSGAVIWWPSMGRLTSGMRKSLSDVVFVPESVVLVLLAKVADGRVDDPAARVAEPAQAAPVLQPVGDSEQDVELHLRSLVGQDPLVGAHRPGLTGPTWRGFAARIISLELQEPRGSPD